MGRHAAAAGSPFTAPFGAVALADGPSRRHGGSGPLTTGSLTRAGIAAALVTASAAAVAGSTGTFPSLGDADVASTGTNLLSVSSPDAAAVPAPRAATVTPVSLAAFLHEYRITFPVGVDEAESGERLPVTMRRYSLQGTPSLLLIDRAGRLRANAFGSVDDLAVGAALARLIDEPAPG